MKVDNLQIDIKQLQLLCGLIVFTATVLCIYFYLAPLYQKYYNIKTEYISQQTFSSNINQLKQQFNRSAKSIDELNKQLEINFKEESITHTKSKIMQTLSKLAKSENILIHDFSLLNMNEAKTNELRYQFELVGTYVAFNKWIKIIKKTYPNIVINNFIIDTGVKEKGKQGLKMSLNLTYYRIGK